jgi:Domain of unknown function (DUF1814).
MKPFMYTHLQLREIFHIEFLRWFGRSAKPGNYAVKGGVNLRFFFNSIRYSEDMDLDIRKMTVAGLRDAVMDILRSGSFKSGLKPFGIEMIKPPDITKAKQTETTKRFKVHLITSAGDDLFTKVEFSRRGFSGNAVTQQVSETILREYKVAPIVVPHYDALSAVSQKVTALATRSAIQARDIFDLYLLSSQNDQDGLKKTRLEPNILSKASNNIFEVGFEQFRDSVLMYLSEEDRAAYDSGAVWDEIKLKVSGLIENMGASDGH